MTQWLRALGTLPEVLSSIPSNHMMVHKPSVIRPGTLLWRAGICGGRNVVYIINKQILKKRERGLERWLSG